MKPLLFILILVLTSYCSEQKHKDSGKKKYFPMSEIKKSFPYNKTASIKLVSFKYDYPFTGESDTTEVQVYAPEIPKTNGVVDLAKMFEVVTADDTTSERLLNILMNENEGDEMEAAACYEPRNGIIFFDEKNNILGYIEICFECLQYELVPETITLTNLYPYEFDALKNLFREAGISYVEGEY